jgi:hypothetical protein
MRSHVCRPTPLQTHFAIGFIVDGATYISFPVDQQSFDAASGVDSQ